MSKYRGTDNDDLFNPKRLARNTDPQTSKAAAKEAEELCFAHRAIIVRTLSEMTDGTFYEIADRSGLDAPAVWRRLNELEKAGRIVTTGEEREGLTGRKCRVWKIKP